MKHSIEIVKSTTTYFSPGQTPVIAMDQPLLALAKLIQWNFPDQYGEDKSVVMFGGLHIEMLAYKMADEWMDNCGWTQALETTHIASEGTAESLLKASNLTNARHAHQATAAALHVLREAAFDSYQE